MLAAAECSFADVIDVTTFNTDPESQFETVMAVRDHNIGDPPYPNWTTIGVTWLAGFDFEIQGDRSHTLDAARTTFSGVFKRPFPKSPIGTIRSNRNPVFYKINNVFRYAPDRRLIEEWAQYDSRLLLERMGLRLTPP